MTFTAKPVGEYPVHGLMPKQDTQAASFIKKFPNYDGRDTVIAILDTGVDPGAAGMQVTTDGKPKVIDIVDCTGAGDVDTSKIVKPTTNDEGNQILEGLSGRKLILDEYTNPSGEYRVGLKRTRELFPNKLKKRIDKERLQSHVNKQAALLSEAQVNLAEFIKKSNDSNGKDNDNSKNSQYKAELEARIEQLKDLAKNYQDPGVLVDCVVFHDGKDWRAVIDVNENGDLRGQPTLTDYRKELKYHTFGKTDLLNFSVNIYSNGDILSIVTLSGSHGTHVAGITAGNFPDEPALNGVAPGAQIVSLLIGDNRLNSMETGSALTRAATHLAMHKVDLANMSFGESSSLPTGGYFANLLATEAVSKSGCIFVTSAGNEGPCYSSIGTPAGMDASFITVGAYVKHDQMQAEYALLESVTERPYTWSSRGPCTDGHAGVDIYAPGSAITNIPVYQLQKMGFMNGTSMSSPNACGCIALLVSALKQQENPQYTPYRLKNAVVQSAKSVEDPFGIGFIQVDKAWEYLENHKKCKQLDLLFDIGTSRQEGCGGNACKQRGIYFREFEETNTIQYVNTSVKPRFMGEKDAEYPEFNLDKFDCDVRVALMPTQPWISAPEFVHLNSDGNSFSVKVDPTCLSRSEFHFGEVLGYDTASDGTNRGPLFRIPVSVIRPTPVPTRGSIQFKNVEYGPGDIVRRFVQVPDGATDCELVIQSHAPAETAPANFMLHILQLVPKINQNKQHGWRFMLGNGSYGDPTSDTQVVKKRFSVRGGLNMEVCLAQFWSGLGQHGIDLSLQFHGVQIAGSSSSGNAESILHLEPQVTRLEVMSSIRREDNLNVKASFKMLRKYIRPSEAAITLMCADRVNALPNSRLLYQLVLTYPIKIESSGTVTCTFPTVMHQLYEHFLAGVVGIVYDVNKKVVGYIDVFPASIKLDSSPKGGEYTVMLQLSTEEESILEKLKETILEVDTDLKSPVSFDTYQTMGDVYKSNSSNYTKITLEKKNLNVFYIATPKGGAKDTMPKEAKAGDALVGSLEFASKVEGGQYSILYTVPCAPIEPPSDDKKSDKKPTDEELNKKLADAMRDLQISYLKKFSSNTDDSYKKLLSKVEKNYPDDIALLEFKMNAVWSNSAAKSSIDNLLAAKPEGSLTSAQVDEIVQLANLIIERFDQRQMFEFYGRKKPEDETDAQKETRKENDTKKKQLVNALRNKAMAYAAVSDKEKLDETYKELQSWTGADNSDDQKNLALLLLKVKQERQQGHFGLALKLVRKYLSEVPLNGETAKDVGKARAVGQALLEELKWASWVEYEKKWELIRSPPYGYALF